LNCKISLSLDVKQLPLWGSAFVPWRR